MLALRELQTRFAEALFDGADAAVQGEIVADGVSAAERIDIYRNNLHEGFSKALAIGFPNAALQSSVAGSAERRRSARRFDGSQTRRRRGRKQPAKMALRRI